MCGIAGIVGNERCYVVDVADVRRMCRTIVHRGPDDEGVHVAGRVGLGMRRLSIIDLSTGAQPIHNEDRTVWVVFNGEIYNFLELRARLEARGHRFYTNSDTEVIVHLYEDHGSDFVRRLRGMFAFALWDEKRQRLLLARDRFGKKPLHYAIHGGRLMFGSEIKALLAGDPALAEVDAEGLANFFYFGYIPDPLTAFRRIRKLPPGHLLEFADGQMWLRRYWTLPDYGVYEPKSEEECLEELEERLAEAVKIRLVSDVPLGALLSGGVDSSTVVDLMARASSKPVKTFSIGFKYADFNEAQYARMVAERFETDHHELILDPEVVSTIEQLTSSLEEPFGDSSMLPTYYISCLARKHVTVALSGDGGDEIFGGYTRYRKQSRRQVFERIPGWAGKLYRERIFPLIPRSTYGRRFSYNVTLPWRERYVDDISFLPVFEREMPLLSDDFRISLDGSADPKRRMLSYLDGKRDWDSLSQLLYLDTKTYLAGDILTKVDRMSMLTSLEVRVPLLDHELVEWAASLTPRWKMRGGQQKYILRRLAERLGVPPQVLNRPKQGFALPLVHWMRHEMKDLIQTILLEPRTLQRGYFRPRAVRHILDEHFRRRRDHSGAIWRLLIFELWHRNFLERFTQQASVAGAAPMTSVRGGIA